MSSCLTEDQTINKLINFFVTCAYSKEDYKPSVTRELNKFGYDLIYNLEDQNPDALNLGQQMKTLNKKAYNFRYKIKGDFELFKFNDNITEYNIYQILKSLQYYLYQCNEGAILNEPLYKTLRSIEEILKNAIISKLEDYKKAKWN